MSPFLVIAARSGDRDLRIPSRWRASIVAARWRLRTLSPGMLLAQPAEHLSTRVERGACIVGDLHGAHASPKLSAKPVDPDAQARNLCAAAFGRYLALWPDGDGRLSAFMADPSGAFRGCWWRVDDHVIIADRLPDPCLSAVLPPLGIDRAILGLWLIDPSAMPVTSALTGLQALRPGELVSVLPNEMKTTQIWRPAGFISARFEAGEAGAALRTTVDRSVSALTSKAGRLIAELSGGFDSSVVGATLKAQGAPVGAWLNFATETAAGDERAYAEALAAHLGVVLHSVKTASAPLRPVEVAATQRDFRPSFNGFDRVNDEAIIALAQAIGAEAVVTGLGGDAVFLQPRHRAFARDLFLNQGWRGLLSPALLELSRWTRTSVYRLVEAALNPRTEALVINAPPRWIKITPAPFAHPWLAGLEGAPPGKRLHVRALTHMLGSYEPSRRSTRLDLIHPLLSQPVLEACLAIPAERLVEGGRDRALARRVFADRLPPRIAERRSKGDVSVHHAQGFVLGLPEIRPFLLDGDLVRWGVIDSEALEPLLNEEILAQTGELLHVLRAVALEAWLRYWGPWLERAPSAP